MKDCVIPLYFKIYLYILDCIVFQYILKYIFTSKNILWDVHEKVYFKIYNLKLYQCIRKFCWTIGLVQVRTKAHWNPLQWPNIAPNYYWIMAVSSCTPIFFFLHPHNFVNSETNLHNFGIWECVTDSSIWKWIMLYSGWEGIPEAKFVLIIDFKIIESESLISVTDWWIRNDFFQLWIFESGMHRNTFVFAEPCGGAGRNYPE